MSDSATCNPAAMNTTTTLGRRCGHCGADISHKRSDARFCGRACKMAAWHVANRASDEGRASERERNLKRYASEAERRRAGAISYYQSHQAERVEYARAWRKSNPERRRHQRDVRSSRMLTNPGYTHFTHAEWMKLVNRFGGRCAYCGQPGELVKDHVVPLKRGGRHAIANILPACGPCNSHKSDLLLVEWRRRPTYPRR